MVQEPVEHFLPCNGALAAESTITQVWYHLPPKPAPGLWVFGCAHSMPLLLALGPGPGVVGNPHCISTGHVHRPDIYLPMESRIS